jgi:hypothetical protein
MAGHCDKTGLLLFGDQCLGIGEAVSHRYLDQHMLASLHRGDSLLGMHAGGGGQNDRVDIGHRQRLGKVG